MEASEGQYSTYAALLLAQVSYFLGCLTLPYAFAKCGLVVGLILLVLGSFIGYWSLNNLVLTSKQVKSTNYMVVCERSIGRWLGVALETIIVLYLFGVLILFQIMCK